MMKKLTLRVLTVFSALALICTAIYGNGFSWFLGYQPKTPKMKD